MYASVDGKNIVSKTVKRPDAMDIVLKGYEFTVKLDLGDVNLKQGDEVFFDVVVYNDNEPAAFSDKTVSQDSSTTYYAKAVLVENPNNPKEDAAADKDSSQASEAEDKDAEASQEADDKASDAEDASGEEVASDIVKKKNDIWLYVVIGVVVVACAAGAVVLIKKKKK